jgi:hypothetical protein
MNIKLYLVFLASQISKPTLSCVYVAVYSRLLFCEPNIAQNKVDVSAIFILLFERSNSQPAKIYCFFKTITHNQIFRIVSTLRLSIHEERISSKAQQNLHGFTLRSQVKAISDTVEHLVPRPLQARPRNSIWRQAKEWSLNVVYILYFLLLFFDLFILFGW